jgi:hypothetical protein
VTQDIEIVVVGTNLVERILRAVPLVENLLNQVRMTVQTKANRPLVRFAARVGFDTAQANELGGLVRSSKWFVGVTGTLLSGCIRRQPGTIPSTVVGGHSDKLIAGGAPLRGNFAIEHPPLRTFVTSAGRKQTMHVPSLRRTLG